MTYYKQLKKLKSFRRKDIVELVGSRYRANLLINSCLEKGYIKRVRRDFYVVMDIKYGEPLLNRYQIATRLFDDAFLSHHAAFELYSCAEMWQGVIDISTKHRFKEFEFNGIWYRRLNYRNTMSLCEINGVKVASLERTVIENIKDVHKTMGMYELIECIKLIEQHLDENEMLKLLRKYNEGFLYQKCGYILEALNDELNLSADFFKKCRWNISRTRYYLDTKSTCKTYNKRWRLYVTESIHSYWCDYEGIPLELFLADEGFKVYSI